MLGGSQSYNPIRVKEVTVTSAQLLALNDSPAEILPAPGSGKVYDILGVLIKYTYEGIAYANANSLQIGWTLNPGGVYQELHTSAIEIQTPQSQFYKIVLNQADYGATVMENEAIGFHSSLGINPTLGNGSVKFFITYKILSIV